MFERRALRDVSGRSGGDEEKRADEETKESACMAGHYESSRSETVLEHLRKAIQTWMDRIDRMEKK
jgi:hypothetical protein